MTRASVSTAGSCCTSTCLRPSRITADGLGQAEQQHEALRHQRHDAGDGLPSESRRRLVLARPAGQEQQRRHRHDEPRDDLQDAVDATGQLRAWRVVKRRASLGQPGGVGVVADRGRAGPTRRRRRRSCPTSAASPGVLRHGVGLAGEQRLVERTSRRASTHLAVDGDLVAGHRARARRRAPRRCGAISTALAVAPHRAPPARSPAPAGRACASARNSCAVPITVLETITRANSASLGSPKTSDDRDQRRHDGVEPGEDVGPEDLAERARRSGRRCR